MKRQSIFNALQAAQATLFGAQGVLLLTNRVDELSLLVWVLLGLAALGQLVIAMGLPPKVAKSSIEVPRKQIATMRLIAVVPYLLIVAGIIYSQ